MVLAGEKAPDNARLSIPPDAVKDRLGKNAARATLMLALAATSWASASRTSGRRASNSEGRPGATTGTDSGVRDCAASLMLLGGLFSSIASASRVWEICRCSGGIAAGTGALDVSLLAGFLFCAAPT